MGRRIPWERGIGRVAGVLQVDHEAVDEDRRLWVNVSRDGCGIVKILRMR